MTAKTIILCAMLLAALAMPTWAQDAPLLHTHVHLIIRSGPATSFDATGLAGPCDALTMLEDAEGWYKIQSAGGEGYVAGWYTHAGSPHCEDDLAAPPASEVRFLHTHDYVNIRQGPATSLEVIGVAAPCQSIDLVAASDDWYQVRHNGRVGFLARWTAHTGAQHCDSPAEQPPAPARAAAASPAPAASEDAAEDDANKCFDEWTWCSSSDADENTFWWNLGWCMAGIEAGARGWTPQACMGRLGTPLPANFDIPGYSPAETADAGSSSESPADADDGDNGGSGPICDPSAPGYDPDDQRCWTDF